MAGFIKCSPEKADESFGLACPIGAWSEEWGCFMCHVGEYRRRVEEEYDVENEEDLHYFDEFFGRGREK